MIDDYYDAESATISHNDHVLGWGATKNAPNEAVR